MFVKLHEHAQSKDKAQQTRQTELAKAAVPIFMTVGKLEEAQRTLNKAWKDRKAAGKSVHKTKAESQVHDIMDAMYPMLTQSLMMSNYYFTELTRKRRYDVCSSLGAEFKAFASGGKSSTEYLFDDNTYKKMKTELKNVKVRGKKSYNDSYSSNSNSNIQSKNFQGSRKPSGSQSGNSNGKWSGNQNFQKNGKFNNHKNGNQNQRFSNNKRNNHNNKQ